MNEHLTDVFMGFPIFGHLSNGGSFKSLFSGHQESFHSWNTTWEFVKLVRDSGLRKNPQGLKSLGGVRLPPVGLEDGPWLVQEHCDFLCSLMYIFETKFVKGSEWGWWGKLYMAFDKWPRHLKLPCVFSARPQVPPVHCRFLVRLRQGTSGLGRG